MASRRFSFLIRQIGMSKVSITFLPAIATDLGQMCGVTGGWRVKMVRVEFGVVGTEEGASVKG